MRFQSRTVRPGLLRAALGALLALHLGLLQAGQAHAGQPHSSQVPLPVANQSESALPPCHAGAGTIAPAIAHSAAHSAAHAPCCNAGNCHCAVSCDSSIATGFFLSGVADPVIAPEFTADARPAVPLTRELRPPIPR